MGRNAGQDGAAQPCQGTHGWHAGTASPTQAPRPGESLGNGSSSHHTHLGWQPGARTHARCHPAPCWDAYSLRAPKSPQVLPPSSGLPLTSGNADTVFLPGDLRPGNPGGLTGQNRAGVDHHHHHARQGFQGRGFCERQGSVAHRGSPKAGQGTGSGTPGSHAYRAPQAGGVFGPCQQRSSPCRCSVRRVQAAPA